MCSKICNININVQTEIYYSYIIYKKLIFIEVSREGVNPLDPSHAISSALGEVNGTSQIRASHDNMGKTGVLKRHYKICHEQSPAIILL